MSRVGKKPIEILDGVEVKIDGNAVNVKGPKGEISREFPSEFKIVIEGDKILIVPPDLKLKGKELKRVESMWGTIRALINNMILGVKNGFEKKLEIEGIGFKVALVGQDLELWVGFTNSLKVKAPEGVNFSVEKNVITVSGTDLEKVSQTAAKIKSLKKPEPYKGKGIRYQGEIIRKKLGKKAVTAAASG
ncbi:MAG: 50S ribosomal protein L6 [Candidatus Nealsonbacteria bacterium]|nr:50S ribosomal protein L6 [Candidatus Nealsonbacteria bacterium]